MLCLIYCKGLQFVYSFDEPRDITGLGIGIDTSVLAGSGSMVQKGLNPYASLSCLSCQGNTLGGRRVHPVVGPRARHGCHDRGDQRHRGQGDEKDDAWWNESEPGPLGTL